MPVNPIGPGHTRPAPRSPAGPRALAAAAAVVAVLALLTAGPALAGGPDRTTPRESTTTTADRETGTTEDDEPTTTEDDEPTTTEPETTEPETTEPEPAATSGDTDDDSGSGGPLMLVLGVLLGGAAGAAIGWFAGRQAPGAGAPGPVAPPPVPATDAAAAQRATLVTAAIAAIDLAQNEGLREQLTRALEQAGVTQVAPDGVPFDPQQHHAVDRLPTHDPAQHNTVMTDRAGWVDGGRVLRLPDVIVYRNE